MNIDEGNIVGGMRIAELRNWNMEISLRSILKQLKDHKSSTVLDDRKSEAESSKVHAERHWNGKGSADELQENGDGVGDVTFR